VTTEYLQEDGNLYELLSFYRVPDDAWSIELTQMGEGGQMLAHVLVPDEDIHRPCEVLRLEELTINGVLRRLIEEVANLARHAGLSLEQTRTSAPE